MFREGRKKPRGETGEACLQKIGGLKHASFQVLSELQHDTFRQVCLTWGFRASKSHLWRQQTPGRRHAPQWRDQRENDGIKGRRSKNVHEGNKMTQSVFIYGKFSDECLFYVISWMEIVKSWSICHWSVLHCSSWQISAGLNTNMASFREQTGSLWPESHP